MTDRTLSPEMAKFVRATFRSVVDIEVLLLLQETADREWTVRDLAVNLYTEMSVVEPSLVRLARADLLESRFGGPQRTFRYVPRSKLQAHLVTDLAAEYAQHRLALVQILNQHAHPALRDFSDAFRIREDQTS